MTLATYHKKRDFKKTPEPRGKAARRRGLKLSFVVQKHDATRLHYDFRLELDGVLKSWAVPKGPSLDPRKKALAVQVEDHPLEYGDFEGVIPKGQYGGGTVLLWDKGTWEPLHDPRAGLAAGKLHFALHGKKLKGEWTLVRMHGRSGDDGKNWLLFKLKDSHARTRGDVVEDSPRSVKSRRTIAGVAKRRQDVWSSTAKKAAELPGARQSEVPEKIAPQLAVLVSDPPEGADWLHEIKFDGYRMQAVIKDARVRLMTRNGHDWSAKFPSIAGELKKLKVDSAILDGEIVVLDSKGRSDFQALQAILKDKKPADLRYYVFDLLSCEGVDLRGTPLVDRKRQLETILDASDLSPSVAYSDHIQGGGQAVLNKACRMGLEGIVSKRSDAAYVSRRDPSWLKSKCNQRQEFVIVGYTAPQGSRHGFGALLLGYHDDQKRLVFAGKVGTGFDSDMLSDLHRQLQRIEQSTSPLDIEAPARQRRMAHWVKPTLVAEVRFTGWTRDGMLRHPAFIALRTDKPASQIVREKPLAPSKAARAKARDTANGSSAAGSVRLTHPDKLLYTEPKLTKQDLAEYYRAVERWMLPHVASRPLALVRCPGGMQGKCFFQRNWSSTMPKAIGKHLVDRAEREYHVGIQDGDGLVSLVQIGVLEIHTWNCTGDDLQHPDQLVFDLDPGPDVPWAKVVEGARIVRRQLMHLELPAFLKTSGGKGLHITVPIQRTAAWGPAKAFCQTIVESLAGQHDLFVANMRKDLRTGKIYIDYHRNDRAATAVAPYSTRARHGAPVSMPISWEELGKIKSAAHFRAETTAQYLAKRKSDPWRDFERSRVDLHRIVERASAA